MNTRIQKWGNSLAVRIPGALVREAGLQPGYGVDVALENGRIVIVPEARKRYSLQGLLRGVTARTRHAAVDTGAAVGREAW